MQGPSVPTLSGYTAQSLDLRVQDVKKRLDERGVYSINTPTKNQHEKGGIQIDTPTNGGEQRMFCLTDVCKVLGLRVDGVLPRLKEDGYNRIGVIDRLGREQQAIFVNEQNLYKVIAFR